eukprot:17963-Heterococcus_DN1.PRE.3
MYKTCTYCTTVLFIWLWVLLLCWLCLHKFAVDKELADAILEQQQQSQNAAAKRVEAATEATRLTLSKKSAAGSSRSLYYSIFRVAPSDEARKI